MPRTIESIVSCHQEARARRRAGRPIWDLEIPIKSVLQDYEDAGDDLAAEHAVECCQRLHTMLSARVPPDWLEFTHPNFSFDLEEILDEFKDASVQGFSSADLGTPSAQVDELLDRLYDWGNKYRVWLG